jgi:hypothetical protein
MTLQQLHDLVHSTAVFPTKDYPGSTSAINYCLVGLGGEVGETLNTWKKCLRGDDASIASGLIEDRRQLLLKELRGTLWYLTESFRMLDSDIESEAVILINELADRQSRGVIKGTGDDR